MAIVGAGFGGIGMAIRLKASGQNDFILIDQAPTVGGTWRDNTYPGCACDIPANLYSFSFAQSTEWSRRYPTQPEIQAYLLHCVERFSIGSHLRLGTALQQAAYDDGDGVWRLVLDDGSSLTARVLILAVGLLHRPALPAIDGLDGFQGPCFHSARWDHDVALAGKHIAVIGSGASAIQFVPRIAPQAASLTLYQRTPSWILPKADPRVGEGKRWALRHVPLLRQIGRAWTFWRHEMRAVGFVLAPWLMRAAERQARSFAKRTLGDAAVRQDVTPDYLIGCKRILLSNDFLPTLNQPHVTVVTAPISRVGQHSITTGDGQTRAADVLIMATGFQATNPLGTMEIIGRDGRSLAAMWRDGMRAMLGLAVNGFPNLFMLGGPNTGLGHNSIVFMLEAQIEHILRCLRTARPSMEVRKAAQDRFNADLDGKMRRTVWLSGCRSWYLDRSGHNTTLWPGFAVGFWLRTRVTPRKLYR